MDVAQKEEAVADASSLIFLAKIDALHLAKNLFSCLYIPEEVMQEISKKKTAEFILLEREFSSFLKEAKVKEMREMPLDDGERATISYCLEKNILLCLMDDLKARRYAHSLGIKTIGVLGILLANFKIKILEKNEFLILLQKLIDNHYYMSPQIYVEVMKELENSM